MKRLFLHTALWQAIAEAVLLLIALRLALMVWATPSGLDLLLAGDIAIGPLCAAWAAIRMCIPRGAWHRQLVQDSRVAAVLGVLLTGIVLVFTLGAPTVRAPVITTLLAGGDAVIGAVALVVLHTGAYGGIRCMVHVWEWWQHLRRTRYLWSLTHTILLAALLAVAPFVVWLAAILIYQTTQSNGVVGVILTTIPVVLVLAALTVAGLLAVLPAALLIAFFSARRLTRRVETLTQATTALRNGQYDTRIGVTGTDELAQLQHNFNAMAGDLQRAIRDAQAERDAVHTLLDQRRQLIANVSHELRTPVATLRGYLDATLDHWNDAPPAALPHDLQVMQRETVRLQALIDDLFTLARAEVSTLEFWPEPTDINALVQRCVEAVAPQAWHTSKVEVVADLAPLQALAHVDGARTEQIVFNLLHNAVRHTGPGGIVAASVSVNDQAVVVAVRDTGDGIAPDNLPHVWERFYRATNANGSGAGLGLALVKELAEAMHGTVAVDSVVGEGSFFSVRLPRTPVSTS
jgi:signal transduction histidine kinase